MSFKTIAYWPKGVGINLGNTDNSSEDTHGSLAEAEGVRVLLLRNGFGGDGKLFPLLVEIKEPESDSTPSPAVSAESPVGGGGDPSCTCASSPLECPVHHPSEPQARVVSEPSLAESIRMLRSAKDETIARLESELASGGHSVRMSAATVAEMASLRADKQRLEAELSNLAAIANEQQKELGDPRARTVYEAEIQRLKSELAEAKTQLSVAKVKAKIEPTDQHSYYRQCGELGEKLATATARAERLEVALKELLDCPVIKSACQCSYQGRDNIDLYNRCAKALAEENA